MSAAWRSLRVRLALIGFLAIYAPVLLLFGVTVVTEDVEIDDAGSTIVSDEAPRRSPWTLATAIALGPAAAGLAWWWAGRAVRPIDQVRIVAEDIESSNLGRRIGMARGPSEVVALAGSFDSMLERLERAADTQRQLIEDASHELRTPLAVLTTNADVLLAHPEPTIAVYREGLERSRATAERMRSTLDQLLVDARGRAHSIDRQPTDLAAVVAEVIAQAGILSNSKGVQLSVTGPSSVPCPVDEASVRRAITNLVDNALAHSPAGSAVEVHIEVTDTVARVVVTDHGPGIPDDQHDRIFERFWRGRSDPHGAGLGLPIARQIARAHGGDVTVRSPGPSGDGSELTFTVRR